VSHAKVGEGKQGMIGKTKQNKTNQEEEKRDEESTVQ
jgi:hypothetical protein